MIHLQSQVIAGQSKGAWLCIQVRYSRLLFTRFWNRKSDKQAIHVYLFAPSHDPQHGYRCTKIGINRMVVQ